MQRAIGILWPSFIVAGIAEALFFATFDPVDLSPLWDALGSSRIAVYSVAFFMFWACAAASSGLTLFLQRPSGGVNDQ